MSHPKPRADTAHELVRLLRSGVPLKSIRITDPKVLRVVALTRALAELVDRKV